LCQANTTNTSLNLTPAETAPLRALRLAFCTRLPQAAVGVGDRRALWQA